MSSHDCYFQRVVYMTTSMAENTGDSVLLNFEKS